MELILLIVIAGLVGYWLSRSRFSKSIDQATGKVSETSRDAAGKATGWVRGLFGGNKAPADEVVDAEFEEGAAAEEAEKEAVEEAEDVKPAKKASSRRKRSTSAKEETE